jgi:hypothetical protein
MFNATGAAQERFDLLESALKALDDQRRAQKRGANKAWDHAWVQADWQRAVARTEAANRGPLAPDAVGYRVVAQQQAGINRAWTTAVTDIGIAETRLAQAMGKIFEGRPENLAAFFAPPEKPAAGTLKPLARRAYKGEALDAESAATDIVAKTADPRVIRRQIAEVHALIDGGSLANKARRLAWQTARKFHL